MDQLDITPSEFNQGSARNIKDDKPFIERQKHGVICVVNVRKLSRSLLKSDCVNQ